MGIKQASIFSIPLLFCTLGCAKTYEPPRPSSVSKQTGALFISFSGTFSSVNSSKIALRKDCFTCEAMAITVDTCFGYSDTSYTCASTYLTTTNKETSVLKVALPVGMVAGNYLLIIGDGATSGANSYSTLSPFASSSQTVFPNKAGLFEFSYP